MLNYKIYKLPLIILIFVFLTTINCKKKVPDYFTSFKVINKTHTILDSLGVRNYNATPFYSNYKNIGNHDTTKFVYKNLGGDLELTVYTNNKKYAGYTNICPIIDLASMEVGRDIFSGCFFIYLLEFDTINNKLIIVYNRDSNSDL